MGWMGVKRKAVCMAAWLHGSMVCEREARRGKRRLLDSLLDSLLSRGHTYKITICTKKEKE